MIFTPNLRSILKSRPIWLWGISFVVFWLFMGVFVFASDYSIPKNMLHEYAGVWFALDSIISVSAIGVTMSYSIYFSSNSLAYLFRNSKMSPLRYYLETMASAGVAFVILGSILMLITGIFFYIKFHIFELPNLIAYSIVLFFISGIIFYSMAATLVIVFNNWLGLRNINFISFISLFLGMGFGYTALYSKLPSNIMYGNFITPLEYLYVYSFDSKTPTSVLVNPYSEPIKLNLAILSIFIWTIILMLLAIFTIKNIKGSYIEEARMT